MKGGTSVTELRKFFEEPEIEITMIEISDVITTSTPVEDPWDTDEF